jgi:inorganic pyrophosphatase/exopolyphosphatase
MVAGDAGFVAQVDYPKTNPAFTLLREVVSRKKQLLPYLTHCLKRMQVES